MADVNPIIVDRLLAGQLDLLRLEAHARTEAFKLLLAMEDELKRELRSGELTRFGAKRVATLLRQAEDVITRYFAGIQDTMDGVLDGVAQAQANLVAQTLNDALAVVSLDASVPGTRVLRSLTTSDAVIFGASSQDWWDKQAEDTRFRFAAAVKQGIAQGETTEDTVRRVAGSDGFLEVTRANARALVHTSIMEVAADVRKSTYQANDDVVEGTRQVSTLDSSTTDICIAYDGAEYDLSGEPIGDTELPYDGGVPRHWGCRSVEVPITKTFQELGVNISEPTGGERASADGPVKASTTFDQFLTRMGKDFQDETLGPGRAELWREDKLTLQQLLDLRGNPLTLAQLEARYA